ncbi:MAG: hypothetical protein QM831_25955 [Kofleriaceae bacterium]
MKFGVLICIALTSACTDDLGDDDDADLVDPDAISVSPDALVKGTNGDYCTASPFNCRFRNGSSRVQTKGGLETWGIVAGASVRDGNGNVLHTESGTRLTFNYGQIRVVAGKAHALALTTSNGSAGWYPVDHISGETSFRDEVGNVDAKDPGKGEMACYEIRDDDDEALAAKKVVKGSTDAHERAGDYLPLVRANGKRSANLVFSVPGFALGGATTDHFLAGTKFRRVEVPTNSGLPSISIPLWKESAPTVRAGTMRFLYGYVKTSDGKRFGWMAQDALKTSTGC